MHKSVSDGGFYMTSLDEGGVVWELEGDVCESANAAFDSSEVFPALEERVGDLNLQDGVVEDLERLGVYASIGEFGKSADEQVGALLADQAGDK